jgi:hypothetical protein
MGNESEVLQNLQGLRNHLRELNRTAGRQSTNDYSRTDCFRLPALLWQDLIFEKNADSSIAGEMALSISLNISSKV